MGPNLKECAFYRYAILYSQFCCASYRVCTRRTTHVGAYLGSSAFTVIRYSV
jgi:hypothetical protein